MLEIPALRSRLRGLDRLLTWRPAGQGTNHERSDESPLRAELFNVEQLAKHAVDMALSHQLAKGRGSDRLNPRLTENEQLLVETHNLVAIAVSRNRRIVPAAEWLLDNFYLIEEQIRLARRHLPRGYSRELPRLAGGAGTDFPRVYALALELVSHVDGRVDATSLNGFVSAYQTVAPLKLGELWALPIMLRLALIENLRRVAARVGAGRRDRDLATDWAERMIQVVERNPTDLVLVLADMARADVNLSGAFLAELTRHLQSQSAHFAFANTWLEHRLSEQGQTIERLVQTEGQAQAADQVSFGNSISSLRFLSATDWREFVEDQSVVEKMLRNDPARTYAGMDFATRDNYRHVIEAIARRSALSEYSVAHKAVQLAQTSAVDSPDGPTAHVGYYLIYKGRSALERMAEARWTARVLAAKVGSHIPFALYLWTILLITAAVTFSFIDAQLPGSRRIAIGLLAIPILLCAMQLAISIANFLTMLLVKPKLLPRMSLLEGIPEQYRTIVVVPTMLARTDTIDPLIDDLEVRYLANREENLHFALLTDFEDASSETADTDEELLRLAREGIEKLNEKYEAHHGDIFFLMHRGRKWNPREGVWMGYERKRGKLADLNGLLRGGAPGAFSTIVGDISALRNVRFVITLDTDTQLPRNSAKKMIGAIAHPLNRPVLDPAGRIVAKGHAILQPRVGVSLLSSQRSPFVRLFSGDSGIDPYTRAVSDVYQDLADEGSFIGKGIYDVDAFEATCGKFPENTILSHDLLEGSYARSALLSDVELYEEHPSRYLADISRRHRWVRGDWQIAAWLLPWIPGPNGKPIRNPINALSWWKIFDNLRRSLTSTMILIVLVAAMFGIAPWGFALVAMVLLAAPLLTAAAALIQKPSELSLWAHLRPIGSSLKRTLMQIAFGVVMLPYEAYVNLDAVVRTVIRTAWTRRNMLEWKTSSEAQRGARESAAGYFRSMWIAPATAIACILLMVATAKYFSPITIAFLAAWILAPLIAWRVSQSTVSQASRLNDEQRVFLTRLARRTWRYFEEFVTEQENWLPPDNIQDRPTIRIASRTSPTNIGLALLANLSAHDFGYCSCKTLITRTAGTLETMLRMERYRGHLYNWYDTRTLKPLPPEYVSMVDSGNLAGNLLVLRQGLLEQVDASILPKQAFDGLHDTAGVLRDAARRTARPEVLRQIETLEVISTSQPRTLRESMEFLTTFGQAAARVTEALASNEDLKWWAEALDRCCADHLNEIAELCAWAQMSEPPSQLSGLADLERIRAELRAIPTLATVAAMTATIVPRLDAILETQSVQQVESDWLAQFRQAIVASAGRAGDRISRLRALSAQCSEFADMDVSFLFDKTQRLFSIGYNARDHRLDASFYDLLASEARLGSYIAIAQDQVDGEHWFALGRLLTASGGASTLVSWSGSMFEYLMPMLIMPSYENTLLDQTCRAAVRRHIKYGKQRGIPWGISESGYNTIDQQANYQYRAFGVPGLGLKRGLAGDLVVAPYASVMALMVEPEEACRNLQRLDAAGQSGAYGFYEAIDYTPSRLPPAVDSVTVRQFMAHHEGMSLLALDYVLRGQPMQRRFKADLMLRAADLLLHERVPKAATAMFPHKLEASTVRAGSAEEQGTMRIITDPSGTAPDVHLLSNGSYHLVVTSAGGGYSRWRDIAVTRWREDSTRDCWGSFCYLRDLDSGAYWSTSWQPTLKLAKRYEAIFSQARAEFRRRDDGIETHTEISVSPEDDVEIRRITITNRSEVQRTIEVTSYSEVVLASQAQDMAHPAFSNLFVQTELVRARQGILCTRRPRSAQEHPPWMVHLFTCRGRTTGDASFETDRLKFIGRHRTVAAPQAMENPGPLSNSEGPVLDPVACIRQAVRLKPHESITLELITGMAETRQAAMTLMEKYHDPNLGDRAFELAWTHSQIMLRQVNATEADAQVYSRLAGSMIYASALRRAKPSVLARNRRGQSGLWGYGISGDLPIMLVRIRSRERIELIRQAIQAHVYWRMKGLIADLVIWNEDDSVYRQTLQDAIMDLVASSPHASLVDKNGGIFVRRGEQMSEDDRSLLQTVARIVLFDEGGTLAEQADRRGRNEAALPPFRAVRRRGDLPTATEAPQRELSLYNGVGGFSPDGKEYVIVLSPGQTTPAPWSNVIANSEFGTVVSDGGSVYTWWQNSHEFRITPWNNDPVSDVSGEAFYIRDEESGRFFSPSPQPARGAMPYVVRHGFGYSVFEYEEDGIGSELTIHVAIDAPVKFARLRMTNRSGRPRKLSLTGYWEWVLGELRHKTLMHVTTELDSVSGALIARNAYNSEFSNAVAFVDCSEASRSVTGDRTEFLGRNGSPANPAAMRRTRLSGRTGAGLDPCAAIQTYATLEHGESREFVFTVGAAHNLEHARQLLQRFRGVGPAKRELERVWQYWNHCLGAVYLETPDSTVNFLANGWLLYQVLASRMWARTGFYQSGGAYGFRDQLQDAMSLVHAEPRLLREQILRAAARQFREGDVQHWWHPPAGRGVRTHFSDDYLWLAYATCRYVRTTGDTGLLEERAAFLTGRPVRPEEDAYYDLPTISDDIGTIYTHCVRAIDNGLRFGSHGLPLMGCGDWNDGMNLVGEHGKGESVWLAFFLYDLLKQFAELAQSRGDSTTADRYTNVAATLRGNIEQHGWDGQWYRRAYFDNGDPLGSASNPECQIDAIPQSWSILSGAGDPARSATAMGNAMTRLVHNDARLIKLLDPPFDQSAMDPGYIKGYVPGVRENGGQYTHAAIWTTMALAEMGNSEKAWELFSMINPLNHGSTAESIATYRVEPYVVAADVYAVPPHTGRGGWTWYTGSAGWMYRLITESLLGLRLDVDKLWFSPRVPATWNDFKIHYRYRETFYHITFSRSANGTPANRVVVDGGESPTPYLVLVDDRIDHNVSVTF